jgi:hypothetical protein
MAGRNVSKVNKQASVLDICTYKSGFPKGLMTLNAAESGPDAATRARTKCDVK